MACTSPRDAWRPAPGAESRRLVFSPGRGSVDRPLRVPCGTCIACRLAKGREWAVRSVHEAAMHDESWFATFTYSDAHLPDDFSVHIREMQLLHKRIRQELGSFRFLTCGEYGEQGYRPHYHTLFFGLHLPDVELVGRSPGGDLLYGSAILSRLWGKGLVRLGHVTFKSAGYVARYTVKKVNGSMAESHYRRINPATGELVTVRPEFIVMSRMPGLGMPWFEKYKSDCFPADFVIVDGRKMPVPSAYLRQLPELEQFAILARRRARGEAAAQREAEAHAAAGYGQARLLTKQQLQELRADRLARALEGEAV